MRTVLNTRTMAIDEFRRKFGELKKELPYTDFMLTDRGKLIARVTAPAELKKKQLVKLTGSWKGTELDDDNLWQKVLKKKSRKTSLPV